MMNEEKELIKSVRKVARALWLRHIIEQTLHLGFYGAIGSIVLILFVKFSSVLNWIPITFCLIPLVLGVLLGLLLGLLHKPHLNETALFLDRACSLQDRLATLLEHLNSSNPLVTPLFSDTMQYRTQFSPAVVYKRFNINYLFQYFLAGLGIIIIWLIPAPYINYVRGDIVREQSERIKTTVRDMAQFNQLDKTTRRLISEMERIAQTIEAGEISPEEIIKKLGALSERVTKQIQHDEIGRELISYISFAVGETPSHDTAKLDPDYVRQTLQHLQEQIRQGRVAIDFPEALKQAFIQAKGTMQDDPILEISLDEVLRALATPEVDLTPALQKFFETLGRKNRDLLERIQARLDIASKEIIQSTDLTNTQTIRTSDSHLSRTPLQSESSEKPNPFEMPLNQAMSTEKIALIKEVLKQREAALNKPYWPPEYNEIIRQYFLSASLAGSRPTGR